MYVPAPEKPLLRRIVRRTAWAVGDAAASLISRASGFSVPQEPLQPYAQTLPMLLRTYERTTVALMRRMVKPGMTVIDGGAHVGYFSRLLSELVGPSGRVLAFEIHPKTLDLLRSNVGHLKNVEVLPVALGETDGTGVIYESPGLSAGVSATSTKPGLVATDEIAMRSIPSVLRERGLGRADFIKLDIEGGEPAVIRSLPKGPVTIVFEVKRYILAGASSSPEQLFRELMDDGFTLSMLDGTVITPAALKGRSAAYDKCNVVATR